MCRTMKKWLQLILTFACLAEGIAFSEGRVFTSAARHFTLSPQTQIKIFTLEEHIGTDLAEELPSLRRKALDRLSKYVGIPLVVAGFVASISTLFIFVNPLILGPGVLLPYLLKTTLILVYLTLLGFFTRNFFLRCALTLLVLMIFNQFLTGVAITSTIQVLFYRWLAVFSGTFMAQGGWKNRSRSFPYALKYATGDTLTLGFTLYLIHFPFLSAVFTKQIHIENPVLQTLIPTLFDLTFLAPLFILPHVVFLPLYLVKDKKMTYGDMKLVLKALIKLTPTNTIVWTLVKLVEYSIFLNSTRSIILTESIMTAVYIGFVSRFLSEKKVSSKIQDSLTVVDASLSKFISSLPKGAVFIDFESGKDVEPLHGSISYQTLQEQPGKTLGEKLLHCLGKKNFHGKLTFFISEAATTSLRESQNTNESLKPVQMATLPMAFMALQKAA